MNASIRQDEEITLRVVVDATGAIDIRPFVARWAQRDDAEAHERRRQRARAFVAFAGGAAMLGWTTYLLTH